jgi:hypothetical protein
MNTKQNFSSEQMDIAKLRCSECGCPLAIAGDNMAEFRDLMTDPGAVKRLRQLLAADQQWGKYFQDADRGLGHA